MNFDWRKVHESKRELRRRLTGLPVAEKLQMLDDLRERAMALKTRKEKKIIGVSDIKNQT